MAPPLPASLISTSSKSFSFLLPSINSSSPHVLVSFLLTNPVLNRTTIHEIGADTSIKEVSEEPTRTLVHEYGGLSYGTLSESLSTAFLSILSPTTPPPATPLYIGSVFHPTSKDSPYTSCLLGLPPSSSPPSNLVLAAGKFASYTEGVYHGVNGVYAVAEVPPPSPSDASSKPGEVVNKIVHLSPSPNGIVSRDVATGHDFYDCPSYDPESCFLYYKSWDHPNMPWDDTSLCRTSANQGEGEGVEEVITRGYSLYDVKVTEGADGRSLLTMIAEVEETFMLYYIDLSKPVSASSVVRVSGQGEGWDLSKGDMGWSLGVGNSTGVINGRVWTTWCEGGEGGLAELVVGGEGEGRVWKWEELGMKGGCNPTVVNGRVFVMGDNGGSTGIWEIVGLDGDGKGAGEGREIVKGLEDDNEIMKVYRSDFTNPSHILFEGDEGPVHGYYYPPTPSSASSDPPPMLVKCHGGPTSRTRTNFRLDIQFWTTRGFAVLDVDYSGSTGYGKTYRRRLLKKWGVLDYRDCLRGVEHAVERGMADKNRVAIDGGSAGGYTTLCALAFQGEGGGFTAGCSKYGISDLSMLYEETHKFESRYMDGLIGPYPEDKDIYSKRCPLHHTDGLSCPVLLLQGTEDKVVPPNQSMKMYEALKDKNIQTAIVLYEGEQHGFRKAENIQHSLEVEFDFYLTVWGMGGGDIVKMGEVQTK